MKATELLKEQHIEVKELLLRLESVPANAAELLSRMADRLAAHMVIEQELFYPAVLSDNESLVLEAYEEHAVARFELRRLLKSDPSDPTFAAKVGTLRELILTHVEEEESDLFPKAEEALGAYESEYLASQMKPLFEATVRDGHARVIHRSGPAVTSGTAPIARVRALHAHP